MQQGLRRPYKQLRKEEKQNAKEKGKDTQLNAEFQRKARRDKKGLSEEYKEIEGKKQSGKEQRSLQENWRYQVNISCKEGLNKGEKWQGPKKKRLRRNGKNTQNKLYKKRS